MFNQETGHRKGLILEFMVIKKTIIIIRDSERVRPIYASLIINLWNPSRLPLKQ